MEKKGGGCGEWGVTGGLICHPSAAAAAAAAAHIHDGCPRQHQRHRSSTFK